MCCGRCCVTEPRLRTALQLDIFIEILLFRRERLFGALASSPLSAVAYRLDGPPRREVAGQEPPGATALQCVEHTTEDVARKVNSGTPPLVSGRQVHLDVSELRVGKVFTGWSVSHRLRRSTFIRRSLEEVIKEDRPKLSEKFITDSSPCVQMAELWPSSVGRALPDLENKRRTQWPKDLQ